MHVVTGLYRRFQVLIHEVAKFGIVGAVAYVIDVGVFNLLHFGPPQMGPITSKAVSTIIAATVNYFLNRHWTFRHRAYTGMVREYRMFIALSAVGLAITEAPLGFAFYVLGLHGQLAENIAANVVGTALGTVWRFWAFRRWVFLPQEPEPMADADARHAAAV